jgi:hypothetical protein
MTSKALTAEKYLDELSEDRRQAISAVRDIVLKNLPAGIEEGMQYGMIGYYVPHSIFPAGYHCDPKQPLPFVSLASQKNHMALYMCHIYMDSNLADWFVGTYKASGKKLDMGKGCVRFKKLEDLPLDLVAEALRKWTVAEFVAKYQAVLAAPRPKRN